MLQSYMQLVSESVKTKQAHSTLLSEKQALGKQLQQINASIEALKTRITHSEDQVQMMAHLCLFLFFAHFPSFIICILLTTLLLRILVIIEI